MTNPHGSEEIGKETAPDTPYWGNGSSQETHCPADPVWEQVAAGTLSEDQSMGYLNHAATCRSCSDLLAEALTLGTAEATAEEEALLQQVASSSQHGRKALAASLQRAAGRKTRPATLLFPAKRNVWPGLAAVAAVAAIGFIVVQRLRPPSDASLIAEAYDRHRSSELRLPQAHAVPLASPTRGASGNADSSSVLLQVKLRAQQQFEQNPNDPVLRQTLGEIALVEHDGETARRSFEMAEALNAALPRLKFDLASAYFELAESSGHPLDYARAIDLYSQHLQQVDQKDPVALFNRGLAWERQSVNAEAIKDFKAALSIEKDAGWRAEMQRHLDSLKAQSALDESYGARPPPLTPASLLALYKETPGDYESYLDVASREWLPRRTDSPQLESGLKKLAEMGVQHHDLWLRDMLAAPRNSITQSASQSLAAALTANARGDANAGSAAALQASELFRQAGIPAGALRAQAEHVYSLQRMGARAKDCLAEAEPLAAGDNSARYAWLKAYLLLSISFCHNMQGDYDAGLPPSLAALDLARRSELPILRLRAAGFVGGTQFHQGQSEASWISNTTGLAQAAHVAGTSMRRYQFLDSLGLVAADQDLRWTRAGLTEAAAEAAQQTSNIQIAAYALENLGLRQTETGADSDAAQSFALADQKLARLQSNAASELYRADWQSDRAVLIARRSGVPAAIAALAPDEQKLLNRDMFLPISRFYNEYASLLRKASVPQQSMQKAWSAVASSEQKLAGIRSETERQSWQQQTSRSYHLLVLDFAESDQPEAALRTWEWFRGAVYRSPAAPASQEFAHLAPQIVAAGFSPLPAPAAGALTLVFARVEDRLLAWSVTPDPAQPVRMRVLNATPQAVSQQALAFRRLCADPHSSVQDIALLGGALDAALLAPFADQIASSQLIQLDLDPSLASIPFAAIPHGQGWLGLDHPLVFLPAGWLYAPATVSRPGDDLDRLPAAPHLLVLRQPSSPASPLIPEMYDESAEIAQQFPHARLETASFVRAGPALNVVGTPALHAALVSSDILHYTGHGLDEQAAATTGTFPLERGAMLHCRLAVLAACRTLTQRDGQSEHSADDLPTFARILLQSGASNVLATQWDVDSRRTHELMIRLYTELANHQSLSQSLRRAQQSIQSNPAAAHPYFWAAFQLVRQPARPARGKP